MLKHVHLSVDDSTRLECPDRWDRETVVWDQLLPPLIFVGQPVPQQGFFISDGIIWFILFCSSNEILYVSLWHLHRLCRIGERGLSPALGSHCCQSLQVVEPQSAKQRKETRLAVKQDQQLRIQGGAMNRCLGRCPDLSCTPGSQILFFTRCSGLKCVPHNAPVL